MTGTPEDDEAMDDDGVANEDEAGLQWEAFCGEVAAAATSDAGSSSSSSSSSSSDGGSDHHDDRRLSRKDRPEAVGAPAPAPAAESPPTYRRRKPTWWLRRAGRPTRAQKRALRELAEYRVEKPRHGAVLEWAAVFPHHHGTGAEGLPPPPIWYEIGCGSGDNLLALAHRNPHCCHLGAEVHASGAAALLQHLRQGLQDDRPWRGYTPFDPGEASTDAPVASATAPPLYANLRVFAGDGAGLLERLPAGTLAAILVTFPDPFPRDDEADWRLLQVHTVRAMHRCLRAGGRGPGPGSDDYSGGRLYLATDHPILFQWAQETIGRANDPVPHFRPVEPCPDRRGWLPVLSKYEQKGLHEGRPTQLGCWEAI